MPSASVSARSSSGDRAGFAPLLGAGIATVSPISHWDLQPGQRYGVTGMGHLAVKLAVAKGAEVVVFSTSEDKIADAKAFGAALERIVSSGND